MTVKTIVLAEDHHIVRQGLKALLEAESDLTVIGEAADGIEAAQITERLKPDILVLDLMMGGIDGLEVARQVATRSPNTRIVVLSMFDNEAYVAEALRCGALAYVLKGSTSSELLNAIRAAVVGRHYLSPPLTDLAIDAYARMVGETKIDPFESLTAREREVLYLTVSGDTSAEIATRLHISPRTVETHRLNLMRKLGVHTHTELVRYALERGMLLKKK
jgi:DNA-binding NarL/FixJ family response regulator